MHFTKYQKKIIKAIVDGKVYDLYSYLHEFGKLKNAQYDLDLYRKQFAEDQKGKQYKVVKKPDECYTAYNQETKTDWGLPIQTSINVQNSMDKIPDDAWEWKPSILNEQIEPASYKYKGTTYTFDFIKGVQIAADYNDIIDFLTLWTYLREQKLILETPETITIDTIGCFFESIKIEPKRDAIYKTDKYSTGNLTENAVKSTARVYRTELGKIFPSDLLDTAPIVKITDYFDVEWKINEEHLMNCQDFLGKKILPNSSLRLFAKRFYKTTEEWHYIVPLIVSFVALGISIFQLFAPSGEEKQLQEIESRIEQIETDIDQHYDKVEKSSGDTASNTDGIYNELNEIKDEIENALDNLGLSKDESQQ